MPGAALGSAEQAWRGDAGHCWTKGIDHDMAMGQIKGIDVYIWLIYG